MLRTAMPVVVLAVALAAVWAALAYRRRAAILRVRLRQASRDLEHLQTAFSRFAPAPVVDEIAATGRSTAARKQEVTVMFADLQGFTVLTDQLDPSVLVRLLNGYFLAMSAVITDHRGSVSKFMGDGLMAVFGMLEHNPWQARDAVVSALAMREALERYNATLQCEGLPMLRFGVGIHRGEGVVGVVGSDSLMDFTAIGDVVNLASRVEALTRRHGVDILLTEEVRSALGEGFQLREMPAARVKGKPEPIVTFALIGAAEASRDAC